LAIEQLYKNGKKVKKFEYKLSIISETMKNTIKILAWINRIIMIPFLLLLLMGIIKYESLYYAAYVAFVLGIYQVLSSLLTILFFNRLSKQTKNNLFTYFFIVIFYFLAWYLIEKYNYDLSFMIYTFFITPVLLSVFWTYILESVNKEL
tara:strand:+ start:510 stop:956 length:447 start_codon:yes stop_codon:yes gene_type:complete